MGHLLPRLLVATPRRGLVALVLFVSAVGPALLALDFRGGALFRVGAALEATALLGFAVVVTDCYRQSERRRVGGPALIGAAGNAALVALLGLAFAFAPTSSLPPTAFDAHYRVAVGGFLGLTIVGVTYHFYPPAIAAAPGVGDRTARTSVMALLVGLALEVAGLLASIPPLADAGRWLSVPGALLYAVVLWTVFVEL